MNTSVPVTTLTDGNLTLRPLNPGDAEDIYLASIDEQMLRFTQIPRAYTRGMAEEFAAGGSEHAVFALLVEEFGERYCGNIEVRSVDKSVPSVSVGYNTAPWARGRGLQTRALRLILGHCFAQGIHRVEVRASVDNPASRRVAENAGCQFEGVLRDAEVVGGVRQSLAVYSRLSTDLNDSPR